MSNTHYCPTCDADFPVQDTWAPGECPICHDTYYVTELYAEDGSDHWPDVQWESQERQLKEIMSDEKRTNLGQVMRALNSSGIDGPTGPAGVPAPEFLAAGPTGPPGVPGSVGGCCGCPTGEPGRVGPPGDPELANFRRITPYHEMVASQPPQSFWPAANDNAQYPFLVGGKEAALALTIEIERRILETMQSAFEADPAAMRALTVNRVPCNGLLADHPSIPVQDVPVRWNVPSSARHELGMIGMIVGIMRDLGCENVISWEFETPTEPTNDQQLFFKGFKLVPRQ
jgi:hypothetical protein